MKNYVQSRSGAFIYAGASIPQAVGNRHYDAMIKEVKEGLATISMYANSARSISDVRVGEERSARGWRDGELKEADLMINKIEDVMIDLDVKLVRNYRILLRDWPTDETFPSTKPVRPW